MEVTNQQHETTSITARVAMDKKVRYVFTAGVAYKYPDSRMVGIAWKISGQDFAKHTSKVSYVITGIGGCGDIYFTLNDVAELWFATISTSMSL